MQRPHYSRIYAKGRHPTVRNTVVDHTPVNPSKCCGSVCWLLVGLLGILLIVLGMLFGLRVLGDGSIFGLGWGSNAGIQGGGDIEEEGVDDNGGK